MALLDKYRGKGRVLVSTLSPAERQELSALLQKSIEEQRKSGLVLYQTLANVPENLIIRIPGGKVVGFESVAPPPPSPETYFQPEPKQQMIGFTKLKPVKMTAEQRKEVAKRYALELAAAGIDVKAIGESPVSPTNQITETRRVLTGQRKAALVDETTANQARQWGLNAFKVPHGVFSGSVAKSKAYIIYLPGNADKAKKVVQVLQKYPVGKRGPGYLAEIGSALGTPPAETNEFIKAYYGESKSNFPAWLGILGLAMVVILFTRKQSGEVSDSVISPPTQYLPETYQLQDIWIPKKDIFPEVLV